MVAGRLKNMLLRLHPVDILVIRHQLLLYHLHRVDPLSRLELHHEDFCIGASADDLDQVEVSEGDHVGLLLAASPSLVFRLNDDRVVGELRCRQHRLLRSDILGVCRSSGHSSHAPGIAHHPAELVALLVDEQPALDALEPLPAKAPDPVMAVGAGGLPVEPLCLQTIVWHLVLM